MLVAQRQPTMRRENTSETNAVNTVPDQVGSRPGNEYERIAAAQQ